MSISPAIATLLDRMDQFPEEFIDGRASAVRHTVTGMVTDSRWEAITLLMLGSDASYMYTPEEIRQYRSKIYAILRRKIEEDICAELVEHKNHPRTYEQLELPLDTLRFKATNRYSLPPEILK